MVGCNQHLPSAFLLSPHHAMDQLLEDLFAYHALLSQVPVNSVTMTNHIFSISPNKSLLLSVSIPSTSPLSHPESSSHQHAFCKIHRRLILHTSKILNSSIFRYIQTLWNKTSFNFNAWKLWPTNGLWMLQRLISIPSVLMPQHLW
jgi:hypothetical protein